MGVRAWWKGLSSAERAAVIGVSSAGIAGGVWLANRQGPKAARLGRLLPIWPWVDWESQGNLADFDAEESDEEEPEGIVYDDDEGGPCRTPPVPWNVSVSAGTPDPYGPVVGEEFCVPPADLEPLQGTAVTFAEGGLRPQWPLRTDDHVKLKVSYQDVRDLFHGRFGRRFGAARKTTDATTGATYRRVHVGVDLFADPGDVVLAPEDGVVIAALPFYKDTSALYLKTDSGIVINLGEIENGSWRKFGISSGDLSKKPHRVSAGQPVAKVGKSNDGSHMLHVETYANDTTVDEIRGKKMRWIAGGDPPAKVLDPTRYLVRAQRVKYEDMEEKA